MNSDDIVERLRNRYPDVVHPHLLTDAELVGEAAWAIEERDDEIGRLQALIKNVARDLYHAEVRRQGIGWDDFCVELLTRSQHTLAAETVRYWETRRG